ncbi:hypothetical protein [Actinoplanes sp. NPDC026623]|uniref:hypothetical protein n=1 Tax=Actinoplanes sp. NPDC026623 TaxID=3155610 RepID=UPI0033D4DEB0
MAAMEWIVPFIVFLPLMLILALVAGGRRPTVDRKTLRLASVERKLDLIMAHLEIREPEPGIPGPVLRELLAGRKLLAIQRYREATGAGLKEAKDAVELFVRQQGAG